MNGCVVIYGASGGIGSAAARLLKQRGFELVLCGRDAGRLAALGAELSSPWVAGDVSDPAHHAQVAALAGDACRGLVYAVGNLRLAPLSRTEPEDVLADFRLHALGAVQAVKALQAALKNSTGSASVVLCSSVAVRSGFANHVSISMAKGAVEGLTVALAAELAPRVRVNAIAPSLTRTPLAAGLTGNPKLAEGIASMHAMGRLGEAQDMAQAIAFLISDESSWISGQIMPVDGGRSNLRTKG